MKHLLYALVLLLTGSIVAQDNDYTMFQVIELKAKDGKNRDLNAALKAHNEKFHQEGNETVNVWGVRSGPRSGSLLWVKGPRTWSDMDSPLEADGHMDDWFDNVGPNAHMQQWEWWRMVNGMNYAPEGFVPKVAVIRYFEIHQGKGDDARELWRNAFKLYSDNNWDMGLQIYWNASNDGSGKDWAIMWFHDSWTSMDKARGFWDQYEEMFGIDRAEYFDRWNGMAKYSGMEILELMPDLSVMDN